MNVIIAWSDTAGQQYRSLTTDEQASVKNVVAALKLSPRAGYFYRRVQAGEAVRTVWVAYGLRIRLLYTLSSDRRGVIVRVEDVAPTDLPSIEEYEDRVRP